MTEDATREFNPAPTLDPDLELDDALANAPFTEIHRRVVDAPIERVWPECLAVEAAQVRALGPLMAVRMLPSALRGRGRGPAAAPRPLLDEFTGQGFVLLRADDEPRHGRAVVLFGAAGRFWSLSGNAPIPFDRPADLLAFDRPDHAVTVARLEAIAQPDGTTLIETETRVAGTDPASTRRFAPYWAIIRLPSGLIRRSWLAAIDRRVTGGDRPPAGGG